MQTNWFSVELNRKERRSLNVQQASWPFTDIGKLLCRTEIALGLEVEAELAELSRHVAGKGSLEAALWQMGAERPTMNLLAAMADKLILLTNPPSEAKLD